MNRPRKFTLKSFKKYHATCRDLSVNFQKSPGDIDSSFSISLRGCEVTPDVNISQGKFGIKLEVPGPEGMTEYWIRCDSVRKSYKNIKLFSYSICYFETFSLSSQNIWEECIIDHFVFCF